MKLILYILFLIIVSNNWLYSQTFEWGQNVGGWGDDYTIDVDKTSDGILLTTTSLVSHSPSSVYGLYKYNYSGQKVWEFQGFETIMDYSFLSSAVDDEDNIYVLMWRNGEPGKYYISNGIKIYTGVSLLKIDSNGVIQWTMKIEGQNIGANILYKNNSIYVLGQFGSEMNINDEVVLKSKQYWDCYSWRYVTGEDFYICKISTDGHLLKAKNFGTDYPDNLLSVTIDKDENLYYTGGSNLYSCAERYTHITKIDKDLNEVWQKVISKENNQSSLFYPSNIYYSNNEKIYLWGYNYGSVVTDSYTIPERNCKKYGVGASLLEFDASDGNYNKLKNFTNCTVNVWGMNGNHNLTKLDKGWMTDLNENELLVWTTFRNPMKFQNIDIEPNHIITPYNEFVYDQNLLLFKIDKNTFNANYINSFARNNSDRSAVERNEVAGPLLLENNNLYLTASFESNPINVLDEVIENNGGDGDSDVLVAKLNLDNILSSRRDLSLKLDLYAFPNPVKNNLKFITGSIVKKIEVFSISGQMVDLLSPSTTENSIDISHLTSGVYNFKFITQDGNFAVKKIIKK